MREVCRVRNLVYFGGLTDDAWLDTADRIRQNYINRVGLRQYLLDMLPAQVTMMPANQGVAGLPNGTTVRGPARQKIIDFLLAQFSADDLPYRLTIWGNRAGKVENLTYSL
jgi:hypothetical protein